MKRFDYYIGIILLAVLLLLGNYGIGYVNAQHSNVPLKLIQVQELDIVDKSGKTKATFSVAPSGKPCLHMFSLDEDGLSQNIINSDSMTIGTSKKGLVIQSKPLPSLGIFGKQGKTHAIIYLNNQDRGGLLLLDNKGYVTTSLPPEKGDPIYAP